MKNISIRLILIVICFLLPLQVMALNGFYLADQGGIPSGMGSAYVAVAEDAHTLFYNPAGMTNLTGNQAVLTLSLAGFPKADLNVPAIFKTNGMDFAHSNYFNSKWLTPNGYKTQELIKKWIFPSGFMLAICTDSIPLKGLRVGLLANSVFGTQLGYAGYNSSYDKEYNITTNYSEENDGAAPNRYYLKYVELVTFNITPSIAYEITKFLSVGGGLSIVYCTITMNLDMDLYANILSRFNNKDYRFDPLALGRIKNSLNQLKVSSSGLIYSGKEAYPDYRIQNEIDMDDVSVTGNLGFLFHFNEVVLNEDFLNLGFQYNFPTDINATGQAHMYSYSKAAEATSILVKVSNPTSIDTSINMTLPMYIRSGFAYSFKLPFSIFQRIMLSFEYLWYNWQVNKKFDLNLNKGNFMGDTLGINNIVFPKYWKNSYTVKVGVNVNIIKEVAVRMGYFHDSTPIKDAYLQLDVPDDEDDVITFGFTVEPTDYLAFDFAFKKYFDYTRHITYNVQNPPLEGTLTIDMWVFNFCIRSKF